MRLTRLFFVALATISVFCHPARSSDSAFAKTTSVLLSTPLGGFFGLTRGAIAKSTQYASAFSNDFGEGLMPKLVGVPSGFIVGGIAGGATGLARGVFNGIRISLNKPFSAAAMSLDGEFIDFDPYDFNATF